MKIIGITGRSGAGKTTLCEVFKDKYLAYIIDSDKIAKDLSKKGNQYLNAIVECFGIEILDKKGELKRKKLADIIYKDAKKRRELNNITFIYVVKEIKNIINNIKNKELIVIDAALLFESKLNEICDIVIGVIAEENEKIDRICKRDNVCKEIAQNRLNIQIKDEYLKENADYIVFNNMGITDLEKEIKKILKNK